MYEVKQYIPGCVDTDPDPPFYVESIFDLLSKEKGKCEIDINTKEQLLLKVDGWYKYWIKRDNRHFMF